VRIVKNRIFQLVHMGVAISFIAVLLADDCVLFVLELRQNSAVRQRVSRSFLL